MNKKYKAIYNEIKKYNLIYIVRHIGPDPDSLGSQLGLRESIKATFPNKKVYALGASVSRFKSLGLLDKVDKIDYENSLLIAVDVPDKKRVDVSNFQDFKHVIKIDHHPFVDKFSTIEIIDDKSTSASEIIIDLINNTKLIMNEKIAGLLFVGVVSDSNRFLFEPSSYKILAKVSELIKQYKLNIQELYKQLYLKPLSEVRLMGYIASNLHVTKNGFAYINLEKDIIESLGADISSASNMINDFNNIKEILVWMFITKDEKNDIYRINIRSRGPVINEIASEYNGGGHKFASGVRTKEKETIEQIKEKLDKLCKDYE